MTREGVGYKKYRKEIKEMEKGKLKKLINKKRKTIYLQKRRIFFVFWLITYFKIAVVVVVQ
jgi:hypothetical protein